MFKPPFVYGQEVLVKGLPAIVITSGKSKSLVVFVGKALIKTGIWCNNTDITIKGVIDYVL